MKFKRGTKGYRYDENPHLIETFFYTEELKKISKSYFFRIKHIVVIHDDIFVILDRDDSCTEETETRNTSYQ